MTSFSERERAFENKFQHDEELRFRVEAKAVKLFGAWAATQLALRDGEAQAYAESVLAADMAKDGIAKAIAKVQQDFAAAGKQFSEHQLQNEFGIHLTAAKKSLMEA